MTLFKKTDEKIVWYIGEDVGYWYALKLFIQKTYPKLKFKFNELRIKDPKKINSYFADFAKEECDVVYVDLSKFTNEMIYFCNFLVEDTAFINTIKVTLTDLLTPKNLREYMCSQGINFYHVKSGGEGGEYFDIIYDPIYMHDMLKIDEPNFCKCSIKDTVTLKQLCRLTGVTQSRVIVEGNFNFTAGEKVYVQTCLHPDVVESEETVLKNVSTSNLIYNFKYEGQFALFYVDTPEKAATVTPEERANAAREKMVRDQKVLRIHKNLKAWVTEQFDGSGVEEKIKALVIDKEHTVLSQTDKFLNILPFQAQMHRFILDPYFILERYRPKLIVFQYETLPSDDEPEVPMVTGEANKQKDLIAAVAKQQNVTVKPKLDKDEALIPETYLNREKSMEDLIAAVKKIKGYLPTIYFYNIKKETTEKLQTKYGYKDLVASAAPLSYNALYDITDECQKKLKKAAADARKTQKPLAAGAAAPKAEEKVEIKVEIKKTDRERAVAFINRKISLINASESAIVFKSDAPLEMHSVHKILFDGLEVFITIVPLKVQSAGTKDCYKGLIHAIDEREKKAIRRFVNSIFFRDLEAKKEIEETKFKEKQQKALEVKLGIVPTPDPNAPVDPKKGVATGTGSDKIGRAQGAGVKGKSGGDAAEKLANLLEKKKA